MLESENRRRHAALNDVLWFSALARVNFLFLGIARTVPQSLALATTLLSCESNAVIATWSCPSSTQSDAHNSGGAAGATSAPKTVTLPWITGFENGFCEYAQEGGFCFTTGEASHEIVTHPVHGGKFAAAFTVNAAVSDSQTRCVAQGRLPTEGYYGAWYYVPKRAENSGLWNLFHFQGDNPEHDGHLWDISLVNTDTGALRLNVFSYLTPVPDMAGIRPIPIDDWFHIEMFWKRAKDETGEVIVYQNGSAILHMKDILTDNSSEWAQWYIGNLATDLAPSRSTLYVDDVSIRTAR